MRLAVRAVRMVLLAPTLALLAAGAGGAFIAPGVAHAGSLAVVSCRLPNGAPAPTEGWTGGWSGSPLPFAGDSNNCSGNGGSLSAYVGDQVEQPGSAGPYWEYAPPTGFTLTGGQVTASFDVPGSNVSPYTGATALAGPKFGFDVADIIGGIPGGTTGLVESTYSLTGHTGGHLWVYAFCEPPGSPCPTGYSRQWFWALGSIEQAILVLSNNEHPPASGFTGGMTTTGAVAGNQNLVFQAAGKLVYLQARSVTRVWRGGGRGRHRITVYGKWATFAALHTAGNGAWHTTYKFRLGGNHIYQMQAVAPQEGGFQNPTGSSPVITISER